MAKNSPNKIGLQLRKLGLVPAHYDFRSLTPAQKGVITKKTREFGQLANSNSVQGQTDFYTTRHGKASPGTIKRFQEKAAHSFLNRLSNHPDEFSIKTISVKKAELLKKSGHIVAGKKAIIPLDNYDSVSIGKKSLKFRNANSTAEVLLRADNFFETVKRESEKKRARNSMFTVTGKIGNSPEFNRARFDNYAALFHYINTEMVFHSDRAEVLAILAIVTIHEKKAPKNAPKKASSKTSNS
jgi:hypothetical protein